MRLTPNIVNVLSFFVLVVTACPVAAYEVYGAIGEKWRALGATSSVLGAPTSNEGGISGGGIAQSFERGYLIYTPSTGAHLMFGSIYEKWKSLGGGIPYGFPTTDELPGARDGRFNDFNKGNSIYWSTPTGAHAVYGFIRNKWRELGGDAAFLRYPTTDELPASNGGRMSEFEGGTIYWHPTTGAHSVYGRILQEWTRLGRETGSCGYPTIDERDFDDGRVTGEYGAGGNKRFRRTDFTKGYILWSKAQDKIYQECINDRTPMTGAPQTPSSEPCLVSVTVANKLCLNADGTKSSLTPGGTSAVGCGSSAQIATARAIASFQSFSCATEGDTPKPGCCTLSQETIASCLCR